MRCSHAVSDIGTLGFFQGMARLTRRPKCFYFAYVVNLPEFHRSSPVHLNCLDLLKLYKFKIGFLNSILCLAILPLHLFKN